MIILFKTQDDFVQADGNPPDEGEMWVNTLENMVKIFLDGRVVSLFTYAGVPKQIEERLIAVESKVDTYPEIAK